ncbi:MAG: NAD(P)/FAD-dependent oxidoreductase [Thaumarchaeota archaeon]|nr:NAD(P)/FAD-dependent oxidoreductase [Nitrososphaerota archaeon]MDE1831708.1 NAD(P)/FAD-dependent oxidoreductase [Nitrososphaerota archaeon]MDE1877732.1 NAD(P)/FAD-dependent oxidoreductase [Nitrososphaerota archaeon]
MDTVSKAKKILVLGGGFAGVECVRKLESYFRKEEDIQITLVSEDNFFLFTPMLPQVASGTIETRHIVIPVRTLLKRAKFYEAEVKDIDPYGKTVTLSGTKEKRGISLHYDYLVLALGSQTNFFGMDKLEELAYSMKTLNDAVVLRNRVIDMLEQADNETDPILKKSLLTFVIVGGGFAGIETAGELMDLLHDARKFYPNIEKTDIRVIVLEAMSAILPGFNEKLAKFALEKLHGRGIEVKVSTKLSSFTGDEVLIEDAHPQVDPNKQSLVSSIQTRTLVWTAGVTPVDIIKKSVFKTNRGGIVVDEFLQAIDFPEVFAVGDCCYIIDPKTNRPLPPTAQSAESEAEIVAKNLHALITNRKKEKFVYSPKGQMAVIGKRSAIASMFGIHLHGIFAWMLWRIIYLSKIPRLDKKVRIFLDWSIDMFFDRDIARLKVMREKPVEEFKELDEVDDVW